MAKFGTNWNRVRLVLAVVSIAAGIGATCAGALAFAGIAFVDAGLLFAFSD